jgi:hypothetical protein
VQGVQAVQAGLGVQAVQAVLVALVAVAALAALAVPALPQVRGALAVSVASVEVAAAVQQNYRARPSEVLPQVALVAQSVAAAVLVWEAQFL